MQHNFRKLKIWEVAMEIVDEVYIITKKHTKDELFSLTSQSRRAAVAMPSNISEAAGRRTEKDFSNFIDMALGSGNELITQLIVASRQKYISEKEVELIISKINDWQNMTLALQKKNFKD